MVGVLDEVRSAIGEAGWLRLGPAVSPTVQVLQLVDTVGDKLWRRFLES